MRIDELQKPFDFSAIADYIEAADPAICREDHALIISATRFLNHHDSQV